MREYRDRVGHRFPGGTVVVRHWENWLFCDAVLAEHPAHYSVEGAKALGYPSPVVHPCLVFVACLRGACVSQQDIFDLMEFDPSDGPLFGEQQLQFDEPVFEEVEYGANGGIVGVMRKQGKRAGIFDLVTFQIRLDREGRTAVTTTSSLILPRRRL